jgi:hypothetical protein
LTGALGMIAKEPSFLESRLKERWKIKIKRELNRKYKYKFILNNVETMGSASGIPDIFFAWSHYAVWLECKVWGNKLRRTQEVWWYAANNCDAVKGGFLVFKNGRILFVPKQYYNVLYKNDMRFIDITHMPIREFLIHAIF